MYEHTHHIATIDETHRIRFVHDDSHQTIGSLGYDTEEENKEAEEKERRSLESGECIVVGIVREESCPTCGSWEVEDSVWGCVVKEPTDDAGWLEIANW